MILVEKRCTRCEIVQPITEFRVKNRERGYYSSHCRLCVNTHARKYFHLNKEKYTAYRKNRRQKRRDFINSLKTKPCMDCNQSFPPYVMDFDHVRGEKEFLISQVSDKRRLLGDLRDIKGSASVSQERLLKEIEKCDLVCSNCHRIRTHNRKSK